MYVMHDMNALRLSSSLRPTLRLCSFTPNSLRISLSQRRFVSVLRSNMQERNVNKDTPEEKWKELLSPEEYYVLRQKGTEYPGTGKYDKFYEDGVYKCAGCGAEIYKSETKFSSGCGWPAFYDAIPGSVERDEDYSYGTKRIEVMCSNCGGHLGHVFEGEGFDTPTNARHCINSVSLKFEKKG